MTIVMSVVSKANTIQELVEEINNLRQYFHKKGAPEGMVGRVKIGYNHGLILSWTEEIT